MTVSDEKGRKSVRGIRKSLAFMRLLRDVPKREIVAIVLLGAAGGVTEAIFLVIAVRVAMIAISGTSSTGVGGLALLPDSIGTLITIGLVGGVLTILLQLSAVWISARAARAQSIKMRARTLNAYLGSSINAQSSIAPGAVIDVLTQRVDRATDGVLIAATNAASWANLIVLLLASVIISPTASLVLLIVGLAIGGIFVPISRGFVRNTKLWLEQSGSYTSFISVTSRIATEARVFDVQNRLETAAADLALGAVDSWRRTRLIQKSSPIIVRTSILLAALLTLGLVVTWIPSEIGAVAMIALLLVRALTYIQAIQTNSQQIQEFAANSDVVAQLHGSLPPDTVTWGSAPGSEINRIEFVGTGYSHDGETIHLEDVNVEFTRGELASINGPSGGGKSTFLKLLLRITEPSVGRMLVNGREAASVSRDYWFDRVSFLPQEVRLIPGTVAENVRFFRDAAIEDIERAMSLAALTLDSRSFPQGMETSILDEGRNLSGGQRQRIGLARCLLNRPDVLVLDEPTSALDPASEAAIVRTIDRLKEKMIVVLVTHRVAAAELADKAYIMQDGRLTEVR